MRRRRGGGSRGGEQSGTGWRRERRQRGGGGGGLVGMGGFVVRLRRKHHAARAPGRAEVGAFWLWVWFLTGLSCVATREGEERPARDWRVGSFRSVTCKWWGCFRGRAVGLWTTGGWQVESRNFVLY
jgi:hypothetical protein